MLFFCIFLIPFMAVMARASGGGLFAPKIWSRLPEIVFSATIALVATGVSWWFIPALIVSYFAMEMGHGTFYEMKGYSSRTVGRVQTIEKILRPVYSLTGKSIYDPFYSWFMMGAKGALIAAPLGVFAAPLGVFAAVANMVLWPTAYWIGHRKLNSPEYAEWISGAFMGLILAVYVLL